MKTNSPAVLPEPTIEQLVSAACALKQQIAGACDDLQQIEAKFIALGKGKYLGLTEGESVTVVAASPGSAKIIAEISGSEVARAREIAGDLFSDLFTRVETFEPCVAFEHVAPKLLTAAKARKLVALCTTSTKGKGAHCRDYRFALVVADPAV